MQVTHRLKRSKPLKSGGHHEHNSHEQLTHAEKNQPLAHVFKRAVASSCEPAEPIEQQQGRNHSQPLVPCPPPQKVIVASLCCLAPGCRSRLPNPREREQGHGNSHFLLTYR